MQVANYINARRQLLDMFGIDEEYFIKPCLDKNWKLDIEGDLPLVRFGENDEYNQMCIIVKKNGKLLIYKNDAFTLIVALDCVKICFIFDNLKHYEPLNIKSS